jgi:hypothetical protein
MNKLMTGLKSEFNWTTTENGAYTYKSTMSNVLDLFYQAPAKRGQDNTRLFANTYAEDALLALKTAFYVRDIRGGQGERETFKQILRWLYANKPTVFNALAPIVPEYGRWQDLIEFVDSPFIVELVQSQLVADIESDSGVSLLAKWMPSINTSSKKTRKLASKWAKALGIDQRTYRIVLSSLRKRIGLVESAMSAREWGSIDYSKVPSRASLLLRKAFGKRDGERYGEFLASVQKGEKKINASTLYPYDLVMQYTKNRRYMGYGSYNSTSVLDATVEAQWAALPNYITSDETALAVVDVSGSMFDSLSPQSVDVSIGLGIYLAQRNRGPFKDAFITFSREPQLITLKGGSLLNAVTSVFEAGVAMDTNIQAVFDMILRVAKQNNVPQSDMPSKIFIFSDMEFNGTENEGRTTNVELIKRKFAAAGYVAPTLVMWNTRNRKAQTPVTQHSNGVFLVSGASPSTMKNALNTKVTTPFDLMLEVINGDRYMAVERALIASGL